MSDGRGSGSDLALVVHNQMAHFDLKAPNSVIAPGEAITFNYKNMTFWSQIISCKFIIIFHPIFTFL